MASEPWIVYIIQAKSGKFYTGITTDLKRRMQQHGQKKGGARFFHFSDPEKVVFQEVYSNRSQASKREAEIKDMTRKQKMDLMG